MSENKIDELRKEFYKNWQILLSENNIDDSNIIEQKEESKSSNIPFLPIEIDNKNMKNVFRETFSLFINEKNATLLELFIDEKNAIKSILLYQANINNEYTRCISIKPAKFPIKTIIPMDNASSIEEIFGKVDDWVKKEYQLDLGNLRIISLEIISKLCEIYIEHGDNDFLSLISKYLDLILQAKIDGKFINYPESPLFTFLQKINDLWKISSLYNLNKLIRPTLPSKLFTLSLFGDDWEISYLINFTKQLIGIKYIPIDDTIKLIEDPIMRKEVLLKNLKNKYNTQNNFLINLREISDLIKELLISPIPLTQARRNHILERALFFYKNFETEWYHKPQPLMNRGLYRYSLYLSGFRYFIKKTSYWAIPTLVSSFFAMDMGLSGRLLIILSDRNNKDNLNQLLQGTLIRTENQQIIDVKSIPIWESIKDKDRSLIAPISIKTIPNHILSKIKDELSLEHGYISHIIWMEINLIGDLYEKFIFNLHSGGLGPKKISSLIKSISSKNSLRIYPETPTIQYIQNISSIKLMKKIGPILTDLHEF